MRGTVTDPEDPRLAKATDTEPRPQAEVYLVLPEEERAKGYVRPFRDTYRHVGEDLCAQAARDLPNQDGEILLCSMGRGHEGECCVFAPASVVTKRKQGCGQTTTMGHAIAETYARDPSFYGGTYCVTCSMHKPVAEFVWLDGSRVGT